MPLGEFLAHVVSVVDLIDLIIIIPGVFVTPESWPKFRGSERLPGLRHQQALPQVQLALSVFLLGL